MKVRAKLRPSPAATPSSMSPPEKVGDIAQDGSIYLGQIRGDDWYMAAERLKNAYDELYITFNHAAKDVVKFQAHGHNDWMLPDKEVVDKIHERRFSGAIEKAFSNDSYWTSTPSGDMMTVFNFYPGFGNGVFACTSKQSTRLARCVRRVPRK